MSSTKKNRRLKIFLLYRTWSLDVVFGTLMVGLFTTKILDVHPTLCWWFILSSSVWIVYTTDHLLDGFKGKNKQTLIYRHRYHFKHQRVLLFFIITLSFLTFWAAIVFLKPDIVLKGMGLISVITLYFIVVHLVQKQKYIFNQKELIIALTYVAGIALAPIEWKQNPITTRQIILLTALTLMVWAEGIMASWFDYENDVHDNHTSFTTTFGKQNTKYFLLALYIIIFILLKINIFFTESRFQYASILIEAIMNLGLLLILLNPAFMSKNERYRIFGEMIFWVPGIIILFS